MLELWLKHQQGDFQLKVDLKTAPGITALFGPSGSGKTSLINMVAGLINPQEGRIVIDERVLFDSGQKLNLPPEKRRLGYVFQDARLFPHLTVKDNLHFGMKLAPVWERKIDFTEVIELLGIGHLLDRRPAKLSGGEKQRVAIGRALLANPRILLMDEPLASLDGKRKAELLPFIRNLAQHFRLPILYVSHALEEILALADNLVLLENGQTIAAGTVEEVFAHTAWQGETGGVIKAEIIAHDSQYGISSLSFPGGILQIAQVDLPLKACVRLQIQAKDVALALSPPARISVRNVIPCRVIELLEGDNHKVNIRLDCKGTVIWSQITALAQAELGLKPGTDVFALIKAVGLTKAEKILL